MYSASRSHSMRAEPAASPARFLSSMRDAVFQHASSPAPFTCGAVSVQRHSKEVSFLVSPRAGSVLHSERNASDTKIDFQERTRRILPPLIGFGRCASTDSQTQLEKWPHRSCSVLSNRI